MNYPAYVGYWFYNAATSTARAALFSSYGLLESAAAYVPPTYSVGHMLKMLKKICFKHIRTRR